MVSVALQKIKNIPEKEVKKFFIIFYIIGCSGLVIPYTQAVFKYLTPPALIINFIFLTLFHNQKIDRKSILVFTSIYLISTIIETVGVNTYMIFGEYEYGDSLGIKMMNTPLIIGINWLFLAYTSSSISQLLVKKTILRIIIASLLMLAYDIVMEQVAPKMDMWYWSENKVPIQNYLAWFILSLIFNSMLHVFKIKTDNKLAPLLFICQLTFFIVLFIFYRLKL